jgi:hypothetical protein
VCKFLFRVATITKTTSDKYIVSTAKDKGRKWKKENAATSATLGTQPGMHPRTGGICPGMSKLGVPDTARESRDARANWDTNRFPESLGFGTKNRWQVEVRQPCCASADRAVILGAHVDALFAYRPAEKWESDRVEKGGKVRERERLPGKARARGARLVNFQLPCSASGRHREIQTRGRVSDPRGRYPIAW